MEGEMLQIRNGSQPRKDLRQDRQRQQERLLGYEEKLASVEWTATKNFEAASFLFNDMKMPSDQEVQKFMEQEKTVDKESQSNGPAAVVKRPIENVCKVCLVNNLQIAVYPCRHLYLSRQCAETSQSSSINHCPVCRGPTADFKNNFV
ncbi:baculoviral IAP repeat-containing protein 8-like [Hydra vulgaris]|uniref:Baculoviral IAP repeat-containing protein 8-like n=1 Tax=Hydra vulgaris TaxID=6087 RepID=A0ABM4BC24_HYDVU